MNEEASTQSEVPILAITFPSPKFILMQKLFFLKPLSSLQHFSLVTICSPVITMPPSQPRLPDVLVLLVAP